MRNAPPASDGTLAKWAESDPQAVADHVGGEWLS